MHRALELNPDYGDAHQRYGLYLTAMGRFDEAQAALDRAQTLDPLSRIHATIGGYPAYYSRNFEGAARQFRHVLQLDPGFSMAHFRLGLTLAQLGRFDAALASLHTIYAALGNLDPALEWLDRAITQRSYWVIYLNVDPALDNLRGDARFDALRARARLD